MVLNISTKSAGSARKNRTPKDNLKGRGRKRIWTVTDNSRAASGQFFHNSSTTTGLLNTAEPVSFRDVGNRWIQITQHCLKPSSSKRRETCLKNLAPFFQGIDLRNIQTTHCEQWVITRGSTLAAQTFAHELDTMKAVFKYAISLGVLKNNPAAAIKRRRIVSSCVIIPTFDEFNQLIAAIRHSDGRPLSQQQAKTGADLVELLAYSGCRIAEATALRWSDVNFAKNTLTVTGGDRGTKNYEQRTIPMNAALRDLLGRILPRVFQREERIVAIKSAKRCLGTACRKLGFPMYTHHDFRHFFATTCIESGVDIPTISRWLGHKDGGALAMKVYGHLRQEHSMAMSRLVSFRPRIQT